MNFPAIAKQTYDLLKGQPAFANITEFISRHLKKISSAHERARFVHNVVDEYNREVFSHPLVKQFSPCRAGCSACCHTQVSVTEDEANLLASKVNEGLKIDYDRLQKQMQTGNNADEFFKLSFQERKCVFLGENNLCQVYNDRPSVCRTNAVIGEASQCSTHEKDADHNDRRPMRIIKTSQADMAIMGSYLNSNNSGALPFMIGQFISKPIAKKPAAKKKSVSNDIEL
jgi:Fe-S-cluster containining protein